MSSSTPSATASSYFGMASRASPTEADVSKRLSSADARSSCSQAALNTSGQDLLTEWTWTGYTANSWLFKGLSWGVSCLRTDCRENQDGWAVQVYACTETSPVPKPHFHPSFSFSWNHELASLNSQLSGLLHTGDSVSLPMTPQTSAVPPLTPSATTPTPSSTRPARQTYIGSSTFVVLDGHGAGGRDAAAAVEKAFDSVFSRMLLKNETPTCDVLSPASLLESVGESLRVGQKMIEKLNNETQRDFGTTCVSVTLVNDLLISSACGDSSALLLAFPRGNWSSSSSSKKPSPLVVELSRRHNLEDKEELQRIAQEGKGKVIRGDGGVLRLIPGELEYDEAKRRGLSINMGRSMGHAVFSGCGLSTATDFSCLALKQIPKLMQSPSKAVPTSSGSTQTNRSGNRCFRLPPLTDAECRRVVESFMKSAEHSVHRRPKSEASAHQKLTSNLSLRDGENAAPRNASSLATRGSNSSVSESKPQSAVSFPEHRASSRRSLFARREDGGNHPVSGHVIEKRSSAPGFSARAAFIKCLARRLPSESPTTVSPGDHKSKATTENADANRRHVTAETRPHKEPPKVGDMFILLMSDGVTDVLSSSCIVEMVKDFDLKSKSRNRPFDPAAFSLELTEMARERRLKACQRADNCTCLTVHLIPE
eukprot:Blabericola_migrator_1__11035@NODE_640_length_7113_cov_145_445501_g471_i0_p2_GENE_NODE_640_length_7113_cov_145_445501_g471_i0NODE_640_length_7113_cov_145_445501_g471_i0_p2_ORF_typecomplete_len653_score64_18PP2C/PF00481_21/3_8e16PP2C/PF00481_21/0_00027PP2C_2/PF13672_6/3_5e06PP2C_2/PF13672_6/2_NODE_640_length_7113_cov_145_445501_g471_i019703928